MASGLKRRAYGRGHGYTIDGRKAEGVTTLIKGGLPSPALMYWSARTVAEYVADNLDQVATMSSMGRASIVAALKEVPWTARDTAAAKGTEVHALAEKLIHGDEVEVPEHLAGYVEACVAFLNDYQVRSVGVEVELGSRKWNYGGTADAVVDMRLPDLAEVRAVIDYKTGKGIYPDVSLQLAAYRNAEIYNVDGNERPVADLHLAETAYAIHLRSDGYDVYPVDAGPEPFKTFTHIAYVARRTNDKTGDIKSWLGAALQPTEQGALL